MAQPGVEVEHQNAAITISVGGYDHTTLRSTLTTGRAKGSMLETMFMEHSQWQAGAERDPESGHILLDCDPDIFDIVLNYLRFGVIMHCETVQDLTALQSIAMYYNLGGLAQLAAEERARLATPRMRDRDAIAKLEQHMVRMNSSLVEISNHLRVIRDKPS